MHRNNGNAVPLVSIIIPAYNTEKYIEECLDSVSKLAYPNKEIIVIDDGSTDKTGSICDSFAQKDNCIVVVHQNNKGVSAARNHGIESAKGKYLFFVDSDDVVLEDYIDKLIIKKDEDLVQGGCSILENDFLHEIMSIEEIHKDYARYWIESQCSFTHRNCYKKELINRFSLRFDESIQIGEDVCFNHMYLSKCKTVRRTKEWPYVYRQHDESAVRMLYINRLESERKECSMLETLSRNPVSMGRLKWIYWHRVLVHYEEHIEKTVNSKQKKELKKKLKAAYNDAYFRKCLPYIREKGSKDEVIETWMMRAGLHKLYRPFMSIVNKRRKKR